jgi:hypothetical protein
VAWIWIGIHLLLIGTIIALLPSTKPAKYAISAKDREAVAAVKGGAVGVGSD